MHQGWHKLQLEAAAEHRTRRMAKMHFAAGSLSAACSRGRASSRVSEAVGKIPGGEVALVLRTMAAWRSEPQFILGRVCLLANGWNDLGEGDEVVRGIKRVLFLLSYVCPMKLEL